MPNLSSMQLQYVSLLILVATLLIYSITLLRFYSIQLKIKRLRLILSNFSVKERAGRRPALI